MVTAVAAMTQQLVLMSPEYAMSLRQAQPLTSHYRDPVGGGNIPPP
jgi:hypothetical protein